MSSTQMTSKPYSSNADTAYLGDQVHYDIPSFGDDQYTTSSGTTTGKQTQSSNNTIGSPDIFSGFGSGGFSLTKANSLNSSPQSEPLLDSAPESTKSQRLNAVPTKLSPASTLLQGSNNNNYGIYPDYDLSPLPSQATLNHGNTPLLQMLPDLRINGTSPPFNLYNFDQPMMGTGFSPQQQQHFMNSYQQQNQQYQQQYQTQQSPAFNQFMMRGGQTGLSPLLPLNPSPPMPLTNPSPMHPHLSPSSGYPAFMNYDQQAKFHPLLPYGMSMGINGSGMYRQRKGLSLPEIETLFNAANGHPSAARSKRDIAILCLILDPHLSSGTITRLRFNNISSIVQMVTMSSHNLMYDNHAIDLPSSNAVSSASRVPIHPFTGWALTQWVLELINVYGWKTDDTTMPIFVNSQPLYNTETGEKSLRQSPLKRDAISKVFQSIKQRSGVNCHKTIVSTSSLQVIGNAYFDWIKRFEHEWIEKE